MRITGTGSVHRNIARIQAAIRREEEKLLHGWIGVTAKLFGNIIVPLEGPREPTYQGTPLFRMLEHLDRLSLPSRYHFADLGAGLGAPCFAAAEHFERVTGLENNPRLLAAAEGLRVEFEISNVEFKNEDLAQASLSEYNVLYLFKPFSENFAQLLRAKLLEAAPGTHIISRQFELPDVFDKNNFSLLEELSRQQEKDYPQFPFYTYVRKTT